MGTYDYILLAKENNDTSPWKEISPVPLAKNRPKFEVGIIITNETTMPKEITNNTKLHSTGIIEQMQDTIVAGKLITPEKTKQITMNKRLHQEVQKYTGTLPKNLKRQSSNTFTMFSEDEPLSKKATNDL